MSWHMNGTQDQGTETDEELREYFRTLQLRTINAAEKWDSGKGSYTFHEDNPLAERKPRVEFLRALDRIAPEIRTSLAPIGRTWADVEHTYAQESTRIPSWEEWEDVLRARDRPDQSETIRLQISLLCDQVQAWADRYFLAEKNWTSKSGWMLDQALFVTTGNGQRSWKYSEWRPDAYSRDELRVVFEARLRNYLLIDTHEERLEKYVAEQKLALEREIRSRVDVLRAALDIRHGPVQEKRHPVHFDWLVLKHVLGYGARTICTAYDCVATDMARRGLEIPERFVPSQQSLDGEDSALHRTARLIGLKTRRLPAGRKSSEESDANIKDVIDRLGLAIFFSA